MNMNSTSNNIMPSNFQAVVAELHGGTPEDMLNKILSEVATAVFDTGKAGEVSLVMKIKPSSEQHPSGATVVFEHTVKYKRPKTKGVIQEDETESTMMHVNRNGTVTLFPQDQADFVNGKEITGKKAEL